MQGLPRPGSPEAHTLEMTSLTRAANQAARSGYKAGTVESSTNGTPLAAVVVRAQLTHCKGNYTGERSLDHKHLDEMAKVAMDRARKVNGCYVTINPVLPDLLARRQSSGQQPKHPMTEDEIASRIAGEKGRDASWWTASVWTRVRRYQFFGTPSAVLSEHQLIDDPTIRL
jgi:hypothetical protein